MFFIPFCYISTSLSNVRFVACVTFQLVYSTYVVVVIGGVVVIIVSSVLSQALCYFVCATVCYMNYLQLRNDRTTLLLTNLQPKVSVLQISFLVTGHSGVGAKIPMKPHRLMICDHHHCG